MATFGKVHLTILKGSDLVGLNPGRVSNTYVTATIGNKVFKTEVIEKSVNPVFKEGTFTFPSCPVPTIMTINVYNRLVYLDEDDFMGTATVTIFGASPECKKLVALTHGGNVKLASKARGGCGTIDMLYSVDTTDGEELSPACPPTDDNVPDFLREGPQKKKDVSEVTEVTTVPVGQPVNSDYSWFQTSLPHDNAVTPTPPVAQSATATEETSASCQFTCAISETDKVSETPAAGAIISTTSPSLFGVPQAVDTTATSVPLYSSPDTTTSSGAFPPPPPLPEKKQQVLSQSSVTSNVTSTTSPDSLGVSGETKEIVDGGANSSTPPIETTQIAPEKQIHFDKKATRNLSLNRNPTKVTSARSSSKNAPKSSTVSIVKSTTGATVPDQHSVSSAKRKTVIGATISHSSSIGSTAAVAGPARGSVHAVHLDAYNIGSNGSITNGAFTAATSSKLLYSGGHMRAMEILSAAQWKLVSSSGDNTNSSERALDILRKIREVDPTLNNGFTNIVDYAGRNAIHIAAWHGNIEALEILMGAIPIRNTHLIATLRSSGNNGTVSVAPMLTNSKNNVLHCAALGGCPKCVEWLLFQPACQGMSSAANSRGMTPYQCALEAGNMDCAKVLSN